MSAPTLIGNPDRPNFMDFVDQAASKAVAALNQLDHDKVERVSKSAKCVEEYAHFRRMGISRELTITHLAKVYDTTHSYLAKICKETAA